MSNKHSQLKKVFGLALLFALVLGMAYAERAAAHETGTHVAEACPEGDTIMVTVDTPVTADAAEEIADEADEEDHMRSLSIPELIDCVFASADGTTRSARPGATVQFADGTYDDVEAIRIGVAGGPTDSGNNPENDGDDGTGPIEVITIRGNPGNPEMVKFTGKVQITIQANDIVVDGLTFEGIEPVDDEAAHASDTLVVGQAPDSFEPRDDPDQCRENVRIQNCVFRNTGKNGIYYFAGGAAKNCLADGFEVTRSTFEDIGYNNDWIDGYGPGDVGSGIPDIPDDLVHPARLRNAVANAITVTGHNNNSVTNVRISDNTVRRTTSHGILVQGVAGDEAGDDAEADPADVIEISYNMVSDVPESGIKVREWPTTAAGYDLVVSNNEVTGAKNSPWRAADYDLYVEEAREIAVKAAAGLSGEDDRPVDRLLKPEIWRVSAAAQTKIFGRAGAPVNIYENFGGAGPTTDGRISEYNSPNGDRKSRTASPIPQGSGAAACTEDARNKCYSVVRWLDPAAQGAIELDAITTTGTVTITQNELTGNNLGLIVCMCVSAHV